MDKELKRQELLQALRNDDLGQSTGQAVGGVLGFIIGALLVIGSILAPGAGAIGLMAYATMFGAAFGGAALGASIGGLIDPPRPAKISFGASDTASMRYGFGALQNTTTNEVPVPVVYGRVKIAGNNIYQSEPETTVYRAVGLCEGEIRNVYDILLNDKDISEYAGCTLTTYKGTATQTVDSRFSDEVTGLRYLAYLALTLVASQDLLGNPNITCIVDGLRIKQWNGSGWYLPDYETDEINSGSTTHDYTDTINVSSGTGPETIDGDDSTKWVGHYYLASHSPSYAETVRLVSSHTFSSPKDISQIRVKYYLKPTITTGGSGNASGASGRVEVYRNGAWALVEGSDDSATNYVPANPTDLFLTVNLTDVEKIRCIVGGYTYQNNSPTAGGSEDLTLEIYELQAWATSGQFDYSNNPAACIRDFLTNTRYGIGLPETCIDDTSFAEVYNWCNALVPKVGTGTYEKRATLNYVIDGRSSALDILQDMLITFGGFLVFSGNKIKLRAEGLGTVMQAFDMDTIVAGSFTYTKMSKDDLPNRVKVQYIDPDYEWAKIFVEANDIIDQEQRLAINMGEHIVTKEIAAMGITNQGQAMRMARLYLYISKLCGTYCTFQVGPAGLSAEVGDIITLSHDVPGWTDKPLRILSIQHAKDDKIQIVAREYNSAIYTDDPSSGIATPVYGVVVTEYTKPQAPTNTTVTEEFIINKSGQVVTNLNITWTPVTQLQYFAYYVVQYSKDGGDWLPVGNSSSNNIQLTNVEETKTYSIRVAAVTVGGVYSDWDTADDYIPIGKTALPEDVTDFSVSLSTDAFLFTWTSVSDIDILRYEIREGDDWDTGTVINAYLYTNLFLYKPVTAGVHEFMIKAVDTSGNYSANYDVDTITVTAAPDSDSTAEYYLWENLSEDNANSGTLSGEGVFEYTTDYNSDYYRKSFQVRTVSSFGDYDDAGLTYAQMEANGVTFDWPLVTSVDCIYTSAVYDIGNIISAPSSWDQSDAESDYGTITKQIRTSLDNVTWEAWETWSATKYYNMRYFQLGLTYSTDETDKNVRIYDIIFTLELQEVLVTDGGNGVDIIGGGTTVTFSRSFTFAPRSLVVSTVDESSNITAIISEQTSTGFKCTLYNSSDVSVAGKINYWAKGV